MVLPTSTITEDMTKFRTNPHLKENDTDEHLLEIEEGDTMLLIKEDSSFHLYLPNSKQKEDVPWYVLLLSSMLLLARPEDKIFADNLIERLHKIIT